ncbi:MAG: ATP-binding cassette domain-containing protein, partial [Alkalibacterium thalassium]|nr:ATP-binding cassette domain-containing protein [Alkalibacterium thalassium]
MFKQKTPFEAVKETNLTINKGEIYGIVGYSGAGKSTLLRMLNGLERPSSGSVIIDDKELSPLGKRELRK